MKIMLDINHPAQVHYFKNIIWDLTKKGHEFLIVARDKEVTIELLQSYNFKFINRGKGRYTILGKLVYMIKADVLLYKHAQTFHPDLFLSFGSMYAAQVSFLLRKPHIALDDTEHAHFQQLLTNPFSSIILTPSCFVTDFGKKQIRFDGYMELFYLHKRYFTPSSEIINLLGLKQNDNYAILRFVSWTASHDVGQSGLDYKTKIDLINFLSRKMRVYISSERELPDEFKKYQIMIPPERMHDALAFATLFIGEGATMASECAMLGTPAIYINSLEVGYCNEEEKKYGMIYNFRSSQGVLEKAKELISLSDIKAEFQKRRQKMLAEKIDSTAFLIWFIENFPMSSQIIKKDPEYQYNFK